MTPATLLKNPSRAELLRLAEGTALVRALRNPQTGDLYAWRGEEAFHVDAAASLDLDFRTRRELEEHSFRLTRSQIEEQSAAVDLAALLTAIG